MSAVSAVERPLGMACLLCYDISTLNVVKCIN